MKEQDSRISAGDRRIEPHQRFGIWLLLSLGALVGLMGLAGLALTGRTVRMPDWVNARVEAQLNSRFAPLEVRIGGMDATLSRENLPTVHIRDVMVLDGAGRDIADLPAIDATLSVAGLLAGRIEVAHLALARAGLTLRRAPDGRFDLALGGAGVPLSAAVSLGALLDEIDRALSAPGVTAIRAISVEGLGLTYEDARAGRVWRVQNGLMTLEQTARDVTIRAFFSLRGQGAVPAEFAFDFTSVKGSPEARFAANFSDVPSADIATQSPALAALALIDAPISGAIRTEVDASGSLGRLSAALEIGAGDLRPPGGAPPIGFASGKSYFTYDPETGRLGFDQIALDTAVLRLTAEGHAYLRDLEGGWPRTLIAQLAFREVALDPEGMFEQPAVFTGGALDLKLGLDPLTATLGQVVLLDGDRAYRGRGVVRALPEGWDVSVDAEIARITDTRLMALWPLTLAPGTRAWFSKNVLAGDLYDVRAAVRRPAVGAPVISLTHAFRAADVRVIDTMPTIRDARGYATLLDRCYTLSVEGGSILAPEGGAIDVTGSTLQVADVTQSPPIAEIVLKTRGTIRAALALIDLPPLGVTSAAGIDPDVAEGEARLEARLRLPLVRGLRAEEVAYRVSGDLVGVASDRLVPGRRLVAEALHLLASPEEVAISGAASLDGVPLRAAWTMVPGRAGSRQSRVAGSVELSRASNAGFGLGLPADSLSGAARGSFVVDLADGAPPRFSLTSDLVGLGLSVPGLGWSKPRATRGALEVVGRLGDAPAIERLTLSAPGLSVEGSVALSGAGRLDAARLSRVKLGDWLDAPVVLSAEGEGRPPTIAIAGGSVDLRAFPLSGVGGPAAAKGAGPIEVALDRLIVSDGIALEGVRGRLSGQGGLNGQLSGTLAGGGPIEATLAPDANGTAIRIRAENAGSALRGAGVYSRASGGALDLVLRPEGGPGRYDGQLRIDGLRVRGTPVLAELLSAVSVVGIAELLDGEGLMFSDVAARFRLLPGAVEVREASAVGPSLGISMAGLYDTRTGRIDMQGVISPIYLVNSIGSVLTRRGEGLFGFNYRLYGDARDPEVRVNPLSILTPGIFREIFRGPPPRVQPPSVPDADR